MGWKLGSVAWGGGGAVRFFASIVEETTLSRVPGYSRLQFGEGFNSPPRKSGGSYAVIARTDTAVNGTSVWSIRSYPEGNTDETLDPPGTLVFEQVTDPTGAIDDIGRRAVSATYDAFGSIWSVWDETLDGFPTEEVVYKDAVEMDRRTAPPAAREIMEVDEFVWLSRVTGTLDHEWRELTTNGTPFVLPGNVQAYSVHEAGPGFFASGPFGNASRWFDISGSSYLIPGFNIVAGIYLDGDLLIASSEPTLDGIAGSDDTLEDMSGVPGVSAWKTYRAGFTGVGIEVRPEVPTLLPRFEQYTDPETSTTRGPNFRTRTNFGGSEWHDFRGISGANSASGNVLTRLIRWEPVPDS